MKPNNVKPLTTPAPYVESPFYTLTEALAVLQYLTARGLLCGVCGYRWATLRNLMHTRCVECKTQNVPYEDNRAGSEIDKLLCKGLQRFFKSFGQSYGFTTSDAADSKGNK